MTNAIGTNSVTSPSSSSSTQLLSMELLDVVLDILFDFDKDAVDDEAVSVPLLYVICAGV